MSSHVTAFGRIPQADLPWRTLLSILALGALILWNYGVEVNYIRRYAVYYIIASLFFYLEEFLKVVSDPREPPLIPYHGLPFVGHVIGMFWHGAKYFDLVKYALFTPKRCMSPSK